ncbi:PIR protein [Plasmodium vivax]|nr:PIR protein [Plasmodium vivax]
MEEFLGKSKLANLNTIINYDYFDREEGICANYPHITAAKSKLAGFRWKNDVSDKILNALCYVYRRKVNNMSYINSCNYLYYWLGSKILTNLLLPHFLFEVVNTSYRILNESELGEIYYDTYKLHFATYKPSCDRDYENTIKSYKFFYNELRKECSMRKTYYNAQYCKVFNDYFTDDKNEEISSWICELKETEEQDQQLEEEPMEVAGNEYIQERPGVEGLQVRADWDETAQNSRSIISYLSKEGFKRESMSSVSEESSGSTIKKSITSAVSAAGVLVPPFIIYNVITIVIYAPARSWINKLLRMNKGTNRNPYANQELMADFSMPEDFYSERNRYNIMYNPE